MRLRTRALTAPPPASDAGPTTPATIGSGGCQRAWRRELAIVAYVSGLHVGKVLGRPLVHRHQRPRQAPAQGGQRVLDLGWHLGVDVPGEQAVALERAQRLGERLLGDLADLVEDLAVTACPVGEQVQDVDAPLAAEQVDDGARAAD